jgi:CheY-like chemotaxis protein
MASPRDGVKREFRLLSEFSEILTEDGAHATIFPLSSGLATMNQPPPILLIEDDSSDARLIMDALWMAGILDPVVWVDCGEFAAEYIDGTGRFSDRLVHPVPCLFLVDLKLPKLSGIQVLKKKVESPPMKDVPAIVLTGSLDPADIEESFGVGAESYLVKPKEFAALVNLLRLKVCRCLGRPLPPPKLDSP